MTRQKRERKERLVARLMKEREYAYIGNPFRADKMRTVEEREAYINTRIAEAERGL